MSNVFIREALVSDMPGIIACAKRFFDHTNYFCPLDVESFEEHALMHINHKDAVFRILMNGLEVVGGMAGMILPCIVNRNYRTFIEFFFWVDEPYRGRDSLRIIKAVENDCIKRGAKGIIMVVTATSAGPRIIKMYERLGYKLQESHMVKVINAS